MSESVSSHSGSSLALSSHQKRPRVLDEDVSSPTALINNRKSLSSLTASEVKEFLFDWTSIHNNDAPWMQQDYRVVGKDLCCVERIEDLEFVLGQHYFRRIPSIQLRRIFYEIRQLQQLGITKQPLLLSEHLKLKVEEIVNLLYSTSKKRCKQFGKCVCYYILSMQQQDVEFNHALGANKDFVRVAFEMATAFEHVNSVMVLTAVLEIICNFVQPVHNNPASIIVSNQAQLTHEHLVWLINTTSTYLTEYDKPHFVQYASKLLSLMPWQTGSHLHEVLAVSDGYLLLLRLLQFQHEKEADMQLNIVKHASITLSKLALQPTHRAGLASQDVCIVVVALLKRFRLTASTNLLSYDILFNLCYAMEDLALNSVNESRFGEIGGCHLVVDLARQFMHHGQEAILERICGALWNVSVKQEHKVVISSAGGCELLVEIIKAHLLDAVIVERCVATLWSLAMEDSNKSIFGSLEVCELLLDLIAQYDSNETVLTNTCGALKSLACELSNKQRIFSCHGIDKLVSILAHHPQNEELMKYACWTLKNLTSKKSVQYLEALASIAGLEDILQNVMGLHEETDSSSFAKDLLERTNKYKSVCAI